MFVWQRSAPRGATVVAARLRDCAGLQTQRHATASERHATVDIVVTIGD
jgi:hypothetical protein